MTWPWTPSVPLVFILYKSLRGKGYIVTLQDGSRDGSPRGGAGGCGYQRCVRGLVLPQWCHTSDFWNSLEEAGVGCHNILWVGISQIASRAEHFPPCLFTNILSVFLNTLLQFFASSHIRDLSFRCQRTEALSITETWTLFSICCECFLQMILSLRC